MSAWPRFMSPPPNMEDDDDMEHAGEPVPFVLPGPLPCPKCAAIGPVSSFRGGWLAACPCGFAPVAPPAITLGLAIVFWNDAVRQERAKA